MGPTGKPSQPQKLRITLQKKTKKKGRRRINMLSKRVCNIIKIKYGHAFKDHLTLVRCACNIKKKGGGGVH